MEKNSSNRYIIKIEKALEALQGSLKKNLSSKRKICGKLCNNLLALQADNSLSDLEFLDVVGEIFQRKPVFFMLWIYPKMREKLKKVYGNEGLRVMDKHILEKFCLDEEEQILHEFNGTLKLKAAKKYVIRINNGYVYVTNHRIIAQGKLSFNLDLSPGIIVLEIVVDGPLTSSPLTAKIAYLSGSKSCYGYSFPTKLLSGLTPISDFQGQNKKRKLTYFSGVKIEINSSKKEITLDRLYEILNEFQMRDFEIWKKKRHKTVKCIKCGNEFTEMNFVDRDTCSDCMKAILDHQKEELRLTFLKK